MLKFTVSTNIGEIPKKLRKKIAAIEHRAKNLRPVMEEIAQTLYNHYARVFDSQGVEGNKPWAPLMQSTTEWKMKHGYDDEILVATGHYKESLTKMFSPRSLLIIDNNSITIGTKVRNKAGTALTVFHEDGTTKMVDRPVLHTITPKVRDQWYRQMRAYLLYGEILVDEEPEDFNTDGPWESM